MISIDTRQFTAIEIFDGPLNGFNLDSFTDTSITALMDGNFAVAYSLSNSSISGFDVFVQIVDPVGTLIGAAIQVGSNESESSGEVHSYNNGFVVTYRGTTGLQYERYDNNGNLIVANTLIPVVGDFELDVLNDGTIRAIVPFDFTGGPDFIKVYGVDAQDNPMGPTNLHPNAISAAHGVSGLFELGDGSQMAVYYEFDTNINRNYKFVTFDAAGVEQTSGPLTGLDLTSLVDLEFAALSDGFVVAGIYSPNGFNNGHRFLIFNNDGSVRLAIQSFDQDMTNGKIDVIAFADNTFAILTENSSSGSGLQLRHYDSSGVKIGNTIDFSNTGNYSQTMDVSLLDD